MHVKKQFPIALHTASKNRLHGTPPEIPNITQTRIGVWQKDLYEHFVFQTRKPGKKGKIGDLGFWLPAA